MGTTAKIVGRETAKARLITHHKKAIERAYPLKNELEKKIKLVERTNTFYRGMGSRKLFKIYDEQFGYDEISPSELTEIESTIKQMKIGR